jgi:N-acetylglucosaminyldiphosphoundecaprenol N-acetyl-beta-D-mannosaminyltransferase
MSDTVRILGTEISTLSRADTVKILESFALSGKPRQVVTVNPEFLLAAQYDDEFKAVLNFADLNTADGIGVLWAGKFLSLSVSNNQVWRMFQIIWQFKYSFWGIIFAPRWLRTVIREKNSGTDLIWSIAELAEKNNLSVFLLGGFGDTSVKAGERLRSRYPNLRIAGTYAGTPDEPGLVEKIQQAKPDILLVAFGPVRQEKWIAKNLQKLPISLAIGLGGTFDYLAGKRPLAPRFLRYMGLEWAFRLITQPYRIFRIINAVVVFSWQVFRYKFQIQKPYRQNAVGCLINSKNQVLICRVSLQRFKSFGIQYFERWQMPQGGLEKGESLEQAFAREMQEEVGLEKFVILKTIRNCHSYDWPLKYSLAAYRGRCRGQNQNLVIARVGGSLDEFQPKVDLKEFDSCRWIDKNELMEAVHPLYRKISTTALENLEDKN